MRAALALALLLIAPLCWAQAPGEATCPAGAHSPALDAARADMDRDEKALDTRLAFADALLAKGCYGEAVHVLEEGEAFHPRNGGIQSRLRDARSMLSEQRYFDGLDRAAESAKIERNLIRCRQLSDLTACDDALKVKPADASVMAAKADALVKANRLADAIPTYRRALELSPADEAIQAKARNAEATRQRAVNDCMTGSAEAALQACQMAQLAGSSDEFSVLSRKAIVLQGMERPAPALDAYIAASVLKPDDAAVLRGIVALTESSRRNDALTLAARGAALLRLGRATEAVAPLKEAQRLSPTLPDVKRNLAAATKLAHEESRRKQIEAVEAEKLKERLASAQTATAQASAAAAAPPEPRKYSNQGPASRSN